MSRLNNMLLNNQWIEDIKNYLETEEDSQGAKIYGMQQEQF